MPRIGPRDQSDYSPAETGDDSNGRLFSDRGLVPDAPLTRETFGRLPSTVGREISAADKKDIEGTPERLVARFRRIFDGEPGAERMRQALDGSSGEERTDAQASAMDEFLTEVSQSADDAGSFGGGTGYRLPRMTLAVSGSDGAIAEGRAPDVLPHGADLGYIEGEGGEPPEVLISNDLGFRENQLAAAAGFAMSIVDYASRAGISPGGPEVETAVLSVLMAPSSIGTMPTPVNGYGLRPAEGSDDASARSDGRERPAALRTLD